MSAAHVSTPRELRLAQLVEQADRQAERDRNGAEHEGAHRSIADLARSFECVDQTDVEFYLALAHADDLTRTREYRKAVEDAAYEEGERWAN